MDKDTEALSPMSKQEKMQIVTDIIIVFGWTLNWN